MCELSLSVCTKIKPICVDCRLNRFKNYKIRINVNLIYNLQDIVFIVSIFAAKYSLLLCFCASLPRDGLPITQCRRDCFYLGFLLQFDFCSWSSFLCLFSSGGAYI